MLLIHLCVVFRLLVRLGSFLACRRLANVTSIPKGPPFSSIVNCRLISISSVLSKVVVVVVVVVIGQTVGSISSRTLAYDCLCTLELCTASMIATS